jgi:ribosome biogenesis GTPase A
VGKSALINRLLGRKVAPSAPRPGVTRQLRWLRLGGDVDLLDTPGALVQMADSRLILPWRCGVKVHDDVHSETVCGQQACSLHLTTASW